MQHNMLVTEVSETHATQLTYAAQRVSSRGE